jgi:L-proline amide hydrolase
MRDISDNPPAKEGYLSFAGHRTWYRVTGESEEPGKFPLLCLHGGPGATWHHMEPYQALAADGRRVICYDQIGCGNSAIAEPHDPAMWTTKLYLAEVAAVRAELGLDRCHVLGHSWGGMLGMAYAITKPAGLVSLLAESSPPSVPFWLTELDKLRADLPPGVDDVLRRHEAAGTTDSEEYQTAMISFYDRHLCRVRPYPDWLDRCFDGLNGNPEVYHTMNGPSEFHVRRTNGYLARSSLCCPDARTWARRSDRTWHWVWCAAGSLVWNPLCAAEPWWGRTTLPGVATLARPGITGPLTLLSALPG